MDKSLQLARRFIGLPAQKRRALWQRLRDEGIDPLSLPIPADVDTAESGLASHAQERMFFLWRLAPQGSAYNIGLALRLAGPLDVAALARALDRLVARHAALRSRFRETDTGRVAALVRNADAASHGIALDVASATLSAIDARDAAAAHAAQPFDLEHDALLRMRLLPLAQQAHVLSISMHHVIADERSLRILVRDLMALYAAQVEGRAPALAEPAVAYADYALWQRCMLEAGEGDAQLAWWRDALAAPVDPLALPADRPRPARASGRGAQWHCRLSAAQAAGLRQLARAQGATLPTVLLAAFDVLLFRLTGARTVRVGMPVANRHRQETEQVVGLFLNTLVMQAQVDGAMSFNALLAQAKQTMVEAQARQDVPFEQLVEALKPERSLAYSPLFQVMCSHVSAPAAQRDGMDPVAGVRLEIMPSEVEAAKFDLELTTVESGDEVKCALTYAVDLFDEATVERFADQWLSLIDAIVADPAQRLDALPLLSSQESRQLSDWNATQMDWPHAACLHRLVEQQARERPSNIAVIEGEQRVTYGELNRRANALAQRLQTRGVGSERLVGIAMERSVAMIVSVLGVLKAGAAYLPLDPAYPAQRLADMIADARPRVILAQSGVVLSEEKDSEVIVVDDFDAQSDNDPAVEVESENLAYCIYTSGSTGKPKGVMVSHGNVVNFLHTMAQAPGLNADDRVLGLTSLSFDIAGLEIWLPLTRGATLVLAGREEARDPGRLLEIIEEQGVSLVQATPSTWRMLCEHEQAMQLKGRKLLCGGEALPADLAQALLATGGDVWNVYGPTETTIWSARHQLDEAQPRPLIGGPIGNTQLHVLDGAMNPCPVGVTGELYIGGAGVSRGYRDRAALTAERFVPDPFCAENDSGARLYRTGDRVRRLADGAIDYLGRADHQVKLRGFRIEPGEIEARLLEHVGVKQAVVALRGDRLVAYVVAENDTDCEALRRGLSGRLPEYMVPSQYVVLDSLPLTANGKLDRRALPEPEREAAAYVAPATSTEIVLARIWEEVMGVERVGATDNFFELGGHSLMAIQVVSRIERALGGRVALRSVFEATDLRELARCVDALVPGGESSRESIAALGKHRAPLSLAQSRLWFLWQMEPGSGAYNVPVTMELQGELDTRALQLAFDALIERHAMLRTTLRDDHDGLRQDIAAARTLPVEMIDLVALPAAQREREAQRQIELHAYRSFDLRRDALLRVTLVRLSAQRHLLLICLHHIASDAWSMRILMQEFGALYRAALAGARATLPVLPIQYADYAVWQRAWLDAGEAQRQLTYWKTRLGTVQPVAALPADRPRPNRASFRGARVRRTLPAPLGEALRAIATRQQCTPFMVLLAAFHALLYRYSGQTDIRVGVPVANRHRVETEGLIGCFINTQVQRARIDGAASFETLLAQVRESVIDAQAHQDLPFEQLVEALQPERSLSHHPLFQVMFNHQRQDARQWEGLPGLSVRTLEREGHVAKFDLDVAMLEDAQGGLETVLTYATDLFDASTVERMADSWLLLLEGIAANPRARVDALAVQTSDEQASLLAAWNPQRVTHAEQACLHELVERQAARNPDAIAVSMEGERLSYGELNRRANRLARRLRSIGVGQEQLVGVSMERGPQLIVALLAVLKAGGAYLPLDPAYPLSRLAYMIGDAKPAVVLTQAGIELPETTATVVRIDALTLEDDDSNLPALTRAHNLAYCIYTSGSTGEPKGALLTHHNVTRLFQSTQNYGFSERDVWTLFHSYAFDFSVWEIFGAVLHGGRLVIVPHLVSRSPQEFYRLLVEEGVTVLNQTPSAFRQLIPEAVSAGTAGQLRLVIFGGEALEPASLLPWFEAFGDTQPQLVNMYGITETTVHVTWRTMNRGDCARPGSPVGVALDDLQWYVLDEALNPSPVGVAGELYIGGEGLARGYLNRASLTAQRFIADPYGAPGARLYRTGDRARWRADGTMEYLGRNDHQVKLRGFRIELGEIEARLRSQPRVSDAVVQVREGASGQQLVAYLASAATLELDSIRAKLAETLPDYMIPSQYVLLDKLPLTANGKLDTRGLPEPEVLQGGYVAPRTSIEQTLAKIWQDVLGVERIGALDNFFRLGGHSLLAVRAIALIRERLMRDVPLRAFFEAGSLEELARRIDTPVQDQAMAATAASLDELLGQFEPAVMESEAPASP